MRRPLTVKQENAIDVFVAGATDADHPRDSFDRVGQRGPLRPRSVHVGAEDRHVVEDRDERWTFLLKRLRRDY
jgi:hypothetical protein